MMLHPLLADVKIDLKVKRLSLITYHRCQMPDNKPSAPPKITGSGPFGQAGVNPSGTVRRSDDHKITGQRSGSQEKAARSLDRSQGVTKK